MTMSSTWSFSSCSRSSTSASSSSRGISTDPREVKLALISVLLVTAVFGYAAFVTYFAPPIHEKVLYEVWDVQHPSNEELTLTVVYTRGQGIYRFRGEHDFRVGGSYRVVYTEDPHQRLYYRLMSFTEVRLPG